MKYRIVYTVTNELDSKWFKTEEEALGALDSVSDDLDEFCGEAITNSNVQATLQVWVPMPTKSLPRNGQWEDVKSV